MGVSDSPLGAQHCQEAPKVGPHGSVIELRVPHSASTRRPPPLSARLECEAPYHQRQHGNRRSHPQVSCEGSEMLRHLPQVTQQQAWGWALPGSKACALNYFPELLLPWEEHCPELQILTSTAGELCVLGTLVPPKPQFPRL